MCINVFSPSNKRPSSSADTRSISEPFHLSNMALPKPAVNETPTTFPTYPDLKGKVALITGIGQVGIPESKTWGNGAATARVLSYNGVKIFGCDLPSPSYCQSRPGTTNGEIKFCIHPNGDVSAQQWFESQFQWINVGQYSNIRKRTEGQLASDRLKGETELQSLQQNTLAYFHAIARQREAAVMGRELNLQDLGAALSEYDISQRQASRQSSMTMSIPPRPSMNLQKPEGFHQQ